jgi:ParB/RepB/Spo0J family partition protein
VAEACLFDIPWRKIRPMPDQPRKYFDQVKLRELADSIAAIGQVAPIKVAPIDPKIQARLQLDYELIDGQRRWHAVQLVEIETLRAEIVNEPDPEKRFALSVVANFAREPHDPIEIARAIERMCQTQSGNQVAAILGKSAMYVSNHLTLLKLHPDLQSLLSASISKNHRIPFGAAVKIARLERHEQLRVYQEMRQSPQSAMKAANSVLADLEAEHAKSYHKTTSGALGRFGLERRSQDVNPLSAQELRTIRNRLFRVETMLDALKPERLRALFGRCDLESRKVVLKSLRAIERRAQWLVEDLEGSKSRKDKKVPING